MKNRQEFLIYPKLLIHQELVDLLKRNPYDKENENAKKTACFWIKLFSQNFLVLLSIGITNQKKRKF